MSDPSAALASIKIKLGDEVRLVPSNPNPAALIFAAKTVFSLPPTSTFKLTFVDSDNDTVTISSPSDLTLALSTAIIQGRKVPLLHLVSTSPSNVPSGPSAPHAPSNNPSPTLTPIVTLGSSVVTSALNAASE